jgi:hypothetical protein
MDVRVDRRHTRNKAPRAPSLLLELVCCCPVGGPSRSGATLRSQPMVRMAAASLIFGDRRLAIRLVVVCCIASSDCL